MTVDVIACPRPCPRPSHNCSLSHLVKATRGDAPSDAFGTAVVHGDRSTDVTSVDIVTHGVDCHIVGCDTKSHDNKTQGCAAGLDLPARATKKHPS